MPKKFIDKITDFLLRPKRNAGVIAFVAIFVVSLIYSVTALGFLWYDYKVITDEAYGRKVLLARMAQEILDRNFDIVIAYGEVIANKSSLRGAIKNRSATVASRILQEELARNLKFVERLFIADEDGTIIVDSYSPSNVLGVNFAYRDWYKGVTEKKAPYVSELIIAAAAPHLASVAVAIPVRDGGDLLGILVMQVRASELFQWVGHVDLRSTETIFFADRNGNVASHPLFPFKELVDLSFYDPVRRALRGERGVEVSFNSLLNQERLVAYEPLGRSGFSAFAAEEIGVVFRERWRHIFRDGTLFVVILFGIIWLGITSFGIFFKLSRNIQREKSLLEGIGDGFMAINRDYIIEIFNKAAEKMTGWKSEEAVGRRMEEILKIVRASDRTENMDFIEHAMRYKKTQFLDGNNILIAKDGRELPIGDSAAPIIDLGGNVSGAVVVFRDLTREVEARALHSDFAHASHQLRTPITKILWSLEALLGEAKLAKEQTERVADAVVAAKSLGKLSDQLLAITEIDQKIRVVQREKVKMADVLKSIIDELSGEAKRMRVSIETYFTEEELMAAADNKALRKALYEVVEDAINYNKDGGKVDIKVSATGDQILLQFEDTGIGIPEKEQALIFSKFFRGSNISKDSIGGGLGLYIAKSYIALVGGKIWFSSEEGKGTLFSVLIPRWTG